MNESYIVMVVPEKFFAAFTTDRKPTPIGVRAMSLATHFSYQDADRLCAFLHEEGYPCASVCNIFGSLVTLDSNPTATGENPLRYPRTRQEYDALVRAVPLKSIQKWQSQDVVFGAATRKFDKPSSEKKKITRS